MTTTTLIVDYLGEGLAAARPATPSLPTGGIGFYWATDTSALSLYDQTIPGWVAVGGGGGSLEIQDNGSTVTAAATILNFAGSGFVITNTGGDVTVTFSGGGGGSWVKKTANYTSVAGDMILADTSGGTFTIKLPATASVGDTVRIADARQNFLGTPLSIDPNGGEVESVTAVQSITQPGADLTFVYEGGAIGWSVVGSQLWGTIFSDRTAGFGLKVADRGRTVSSLAGNNGLNWFLATATNGNLGRSTGLLYFEFAVGEANAGSNMMTVGVAGAAPNYGQSVGADTTSWGYYNGGAGKQFNGGFGSGTTFASGDVIGIAINFGSGSIAWYKNNVLLDSFSGQTFSTQFPAVACNNTRPDGEVTLCTNALQCAYAPPASFSYWDS